MPISPSSPQTIPAGDITSDIDTTGYVAFTVDRPPFGSPPLSVVFTASRRGRIPAQVTVEIPSQDISPPDLDVKAAPGSTNYTITYTVSATTFDYSVDGGAYGAVPGSGFTVTRNAAGLADKTLAFRATRDGQTVTSMITVPAQEAAGSNTPAILSIFADNYDAPGDGGGSVDVSWITSNIPAAATFDLHWKITAGSTSAPDEDDEIGITSPYTLNAPLGPAAPEGRLIITAHLDGEMLCKGVFDGAFNL